MKSHRVKHPDRNTARRTTEKAVRRGRLNRQPCEVCGDSAQAHHDDYSKPLEVRWLCRKHHNEFHLNNKQKESIQSAVI
jgi:hypothetical protein